MGERWQYLNNLGDNSDHKIAGFYNDNCIGVCLTNVALAMIMSNTALMSILSHKYNACPKDVHEDITNLTHYITQNYGAEKDQKVSEILIKGVCETRNNQIHNGAYGLAGDYVISKFFTNNEKTRLRINPNLVAPIIREKTNQIVPTTERLHTIISDIILVEMVDGGGEFYSFAYYPNVEVLNIGILINSVRHDPIDVTPFQPGYYADLGNETMDELREDLTEKKITPKVIHLGFYPKGRMRIHEMTYISFSAFLHRIKHLQMEELPPPDFEIFIQSQRFTMPKINDNENVHYSFPIENGDADFQLKAVSFFLQYEYVTFPKDLIPVENPSPSVHNCTNKFLRKRETYANILGEGHLDFLDNYIKKYIKYFYAMCNAALDVEFYKTHVYNQGPHTFSINRRDDGWVLMNDQHSFEIDNIGQMSEMLKNEVVDAIVLEIETGKRLKE